IVVDVRDQGADAALDLLDYVMDTVSERLQSLQDEVGVEESAAVRSMVLAVDSMAEADYQSLIRMLVVVVGGGVVAALIVALVLDALLMRRRRHRSGLVRGK